MRMTGLVFVVAVASACVSGCKSVPNEIERRAFGDNVKPDAVDACINTANKEREQLKLHQNLASGLNLLVVIVGVLGSLTTAFVPAPKRRRQAGALFAGLTLILGAVPTAMDDPQKLRESFEARRRLWDEAVIAQEQVEEYSSAIAAIDVKGNENAPAVKKAQVELLKHNKYVKEVLNRCSAAVADRPPDRPSFSDDVFELAVATVKEEVPATPDTVVLRDKYEANPVASRVQLKEYVKKNPAMSAKARSVINSLNPADPLGGL